jgi:hypothetical protein
MKGKEHLSRTGAVARKIVSVQTRAMASFASLGSHLRDASTTKFLQDLKGLI